ncbi:hypothetical protein [Mammaliicoccus lentus]|nr:hypothetical protein [Mammaliicoccus lentus]
MKKPEHEIKLVTGEHYYIDSVTYEVLRQGTNKKRLYENYFIS